jgi:NAD(P)-dependent dehydrogenase (short-subunit alcohol dehydrogenase family)
MGADAMTVADKVVVITGGTRGIGRAVAEECARQGAHVVICGRDKAATERAAAQASTAAGAGAGVVLGIGADVSRYADVERLRDSAFAAHGRIDVWFNNAGISLGYAPVDEEEPADISRIVGINLTGHLYACRAILPHFREHGGYLMNMAGRGYRGEATPNTAIYAATKTAIASLTHSLAAENKDVPNLSVNAIVPGMVATDFYEDLRISPRLERTRDNWRYALECFGVPLETVARETTRLLGESPGRESGRIYSLLTPGRTARGIAKITWYRMSGKLPRE